MQLVISTRKQLQCVLEDNRNKITDKSYQPIILHFDATGNVCRNPGSNKMDKIFYYAMVTRLEKVIMPVLQAFSAEHSTKAICIMLKQFK